MAGDGPKRHDRDAGGQGQAVVLAAVKCRAVGALRVKAYCDPIPTPARVIAGVMPVPA